MKKAQKILERYHDTGDLQYLKDGKVCEYDANLLNPLLSLTKDVTILWRGISYDGAVLPFIKTLESTGNVLINRLTSTSPSLETAVNFMSWNPEDADKTYAMFKIVVAKNYPVIDFDVALPNRLFYGEKEILLLPANNLKPLHFVLRKKSSFPRQKSKETLLIAKIMKEKYIKEYEHATGKQSDYSNYDINKIKFILFEVEAFYI